MNESVSVSFPTDTDGFLSQECPSCNLQFKAQFSDGNEASISHCPYCGHRGEQCWYTTEQVEYLQAVAVSRFVRPELEKFARQLNGSENGLIKMKLDSDFSAPSAPPMEADGDFNLIKFACCNETIKATESDHYFCVRCGMEINMATNEAKKIFLSHKGVDKELVLSFKRILEAIGYSAWLDEDAMPAGTSLERAILAGMQESCGVIFFLTPSFKDEGYLETEVNYAIAEKRKKGDRFAIVALQFVDSEGNVGAIPELLKTYVWKKPHSNLDALREIVRALPVAPGGIDWRAGIVGVVTSPQPKSVTSQLSTEAESILVTAASGDGVIMHLRHMGGELIQANNKQLIPSTERRVVMQWVGGLEDLQRRRLVKDIGNKGEIFEVTREGYELADALRHSKVEVNG